MNEFSTADQVRSLPRRAQVAFAVRCARRVQPLVEGMTVEGKKAIERALAMSEDFCRGDDVAAADASAADAYSNASIAARDTASDAAYAARLIRGADAPGHPARAAKAVSSDDAKAAASYDAAGAAARAAAATSAAAAGADDWDAEVADAADSAVRASEAADYAYSDHSVAAFAADAASTADLHRLQSLVRDTEDLQGWKIDPSESGPLGPLWPDGAPDWFTNPPKANYSSPVLDEAEEPGRLILEAYVDEFADTEEVATALANLGYALNAYHIAAGGNGLVVDDWQIFVPEPEYAGVDEP